jgi:U3 small nucleolar RNA-associated protein 5
MPTTPSTPLFHAGFSGATLLVARGNTAKPTFERIPIAAPLATQQQQQQLISLPPLTEGVLLRGGGDGKQQQAAAGKAKGAANGPAAAPADVEMLGPENEGMLVLPRAAAAAAGKKRPQPDQEDEPAAAADEGGDADEEDDEEVEGEVTLGERIAALELRAAAGGNEDAEAAAAAGAALLDGPVKADSLAVLLQQALRSGDKALLERCLGLSDARVVRNSVRRLLPMDAAALLRACVERLQSRPVRGQQLAGWIRAVLLHHTAYLMAAPGVQPVMTSLYQVGGVWLLVWGLDGLTF